MTQKKILNAATTEAKELQEKGWEVVARSWGAGIDPELLEADKLSRFIDEALPIIIRPLTIADVEAVVEFDEMTFKDFPGDIATKREKPLISDEATPSEVRLGWGVFSNNQMVGMLYVDIVGRHGNGVEIDFYSVNSALKGKGVGKALLATAILKMIAEGIKSIRTGVADENVASITALESVGFVRDEEWLTLAAN